MTSSVAVATAPGDKVTTAGLLVVTRAAGAPTSLAALPATPETPG